MFPRPSMDQRPSNEIASSQPTHGVERRQDRLALGEAVKRVGH